MQNIRQRIEKLEEQLSKNETEIPLQTIKRRQACLIAYYSGISKEPEMTAFANKHGATKSQEKDNARVFQRLVDQHNNPNWHKEESERLKNKYAHAGGGV